MASSGKRSRLGLSYGAPDIARMRNGAAAASRAHVTGATVRRAVSMGESNALLSSERFAFATKVFACVIAIIVLAFLSLGIMGAAGDLYPYSQRYDLYTPLQVGSVLFEQAHNALANLTHQFPAHSNEWIRENVPGYWAVPRRASVLGITFVCAELLAVSGMLYQNVFRNPIAAPGMLGVTSGVSLGLMILVAIYHAAAPSMLYERYAMCYGFGAVILVAVLVAGKRLSGAGRPYDIVTMLLIGSIFSQLIGFVVSYVTLFVMEEDDYLVFYTLSQMLTVSTSLISWVTLGVAALASFVPIWMNRHKMNVLAFDDQEARLLGVNSSRMRALALVCGAIMILAATIHVGLVALVSLVVPFISRAVFGCEFNKQLIGNLCISPILLIACRDITDLLPFIGEGLAIGSVVSVVALPLFVVLMARHVRGWE